MNRLMIIALLLIVALPSSIQTHAQGAPKCDPTPLIKQAAALKSSKDAKKDMESLAALAKDIESMQLLCQTASKTYPQAEDGSGTRAKPVPAGSSMSVTKDSVFEFVMTITQVYRGKQALDMVKKANSFNSAPPPDREYLVAYVDINYKNGPEDKPLTLSWTDIKALSKGQVIDDINLTVAPKPSLDIKFFPGAAGGGWIVKEVYADDPSPLLIFGVSYDGSGGVYFSAQISKSS